MTRVYRTGAVGALMDEYERAMADLIRVIDGIDEANYVQIRDTETADESCRSIQTIVTHVVSAGHGYAAMMRKALGIEGSRPERTDVPRPDAVRRLRDVLDDTLRTVDGHWNMPENVAMGMAIHSPWGQVFDFEQLFEHAIVHVLRHRRQIERFLTTGRDRAS